MKKILNVIKDDAIYLSKRLDVLSIVMLILIPLLISMGVNDTSGIKEVRYTFYSFAYLILALLVERLAIQYLEREKENDENIEDPT